MHNYFANLGWLGASLWASAIHMIPLLFIPIAKKSGVPMSIYLFWFITAAAVGVALSHAGIGAVPTAATTLKDVFTKPPAVLLFGSVALGSVVGGSYLLLLIQSAEKAAVVGANPALSFIIMAVGVIAAYILLGFKYGVSPKFLVGIALVLAGGYLIKTSLHF